MSAINLSATCNPKCLHFHDCDGLECHLYNYAICKTMQYINTLFSWDIKHEAFLMSLWHRILYLKSVVYDETFSWLCFNPLIVNQSTGFYMIETSIMKELRILSNIFEGIFLQQQSTAFGRQLFSQKFYHHYLKASLIRLCIYFIASQIKRFLKIAEETHPQEITRKLSYCKLFELGKKNLLEKLTLINPETILFAFNIFRRLIFFIFLYIAYFIFWFTFST